LYAQKKVCYAYYVASKNTGKFFRRDGSPLDTSVNTISAVLPTAAVLVDKELFSISSDKNIKTTILDRVVALKQRIKLPQTNLKLPEVQTKTLVRWSAISTGGFVAAALMLLLIPMKLRPQVDKYAIYTSKPLVLAKTSYDIYTKDSRSQRIDEIFKAYNCPLEGMGEKFVHEADKNDIPWWIAASIAFQESSCGKNTPKVDGAESYNAWGWAVYGDNVHTFDNWARGIETVSKYLSKRFFSQGITETCEIMRVYTPPSNGSWCNGVDHFRNQIENYKTPAQL
jgi:hypothetical protein